jgi:hypothetical protein
VSETYWRVDESARAASGAIVPGEYGARGHTDLLFFDPGI